jgi:purine-binding chemotaxis protein CheW
MKKKIRYSDLQTAAPTPLTKFTPASSAVVPRARAEAAVTPPAAEPEPKPAKATKARAPKEKAAKATTPKATTKTATPKARTPKPRASAAKSPATKAAMPESPTAPEAIVTVSEPVTEAVTPRARRDSAPIELARALQQARAAEAVQAAEVLAHVEARAAAAHARSLAEAEAAATAGTVVASPAGDAAAAGETKQPFVYQRMAPPDEYELDDDAFEMRGPRRPLRERVRSRSGTVELLMFRIGTERFAVELVCVEEAIDLPDVHHVPEMPPAMLGVITVRDTLTPVFTPNDALGVPVEGRGAALIFRSDRGRFALAIDDVDDVMTLDLAALRDAPGSEVADSVVLGVARIGDSILALVDADALVLVCQAIPALELV